MLENSLIGFGVFYFLHLILWNVKPSNTPRMYRMFFLMFIGLVVSLGLLVPQRSISLMNIVTILNISSFLYVAYLFFYAGICRSVSLTILIQALQSPNGTLRLDKILSDYLASSRISERFDIMHKSGWVKTQDQIVSLTPKGARIARVVQFMSFLLSGKLEG